MQTLLSIFRITNHLVSLSLADLTDEVARRRTRGSEGPSITWTVGHLLDSRHELLAFLGDERPSPWSESFGDRAATDGADYPTIDIMRAEWKKVHETVEQTFAKAAAETLDQPIPGTGIHGETRIRDKVTFLAWHEAYHTGVIGVARIAAGMEGPADLARAASGQK